MEEIIKIVDPVIKVIFKFRLIRGLWWSLGKSIGSMRCAGDMDKCEMKHENGDDLPIDASTKFEI